jgi:hypothetical protein
MTIHYYPCSLALIEDKRAYTAYMNYLRTTRTYNGV